MHSYGNRKKCPIPVVLETVGESNMSICFPCTDIVCRHTKSYTTNCIKRDSSSTSYYCATFHEEICSFCESSTSTKSHDIDTELYPSFSIESSASFCSNHSSGGHDSSEKYSSNNSTSSSCNWSQHHSPDSSNCRSDHSSSLSCKIPVSCLKIPVILRSHYRDHCIKCLLSFCGIKSWSIFLEFCKKILHIFLIFSIYFFIYIFPF